ncbi:MAG: rod shape-determining protein MreC [Bacteroidota bacterium]|nr:rod shape-determining protein MreC [Bacteroidota bacterium]
MRNILLFIRIYFNFLFFLCLMGISLFMVFSYNRYQHTAYSAVAGEVAGRISNQFSTVESYFELKRTNDSLMKVNARLYNQLKNDFELPDTVSNSRVDSVRMDTSILARKYLYLPARVVGNSVSLENNYLELHRGLQQGVEKDLAVTDIFNNVVGSIVDVSNNYSVVMSLLHRQSNVSAKLKRNGVTGSIIWDGVDPNFVILKDIPADIKVFPGDTVVTSGFSDKFPYGLLIGTVWKVDHEKNGQVASMKVKTAANFYNLQYVYIIKNLQKQEPSQLLNRFQKTNE